MGGKFDPMALPPDEPNPTWAALFDPGPDLTCSAPDPEVNPKSS